MVLAEASTDGEEILLGEVDVGRIEEVRRSWPFLRDRRVDAYQGIDPASSTQATVAPPRSPADRGYAMPAEWAPHAATWIAWPHAGRDWPGRLGPVPWEGGDLVKMDAEGETVLHRAHRVVRLELDEEIDALAGARRRIRTTGVRPIVSRMLSYIPASPLDGAQCG